MDRQANWIDVSSFEDAGFEVELDVNAREGAPHQWRHRPRCFTDEACAEWEFGQPPQKSPA